MPINVTLDTTPATSIELVRTDGRFRAVWKLTTPADAYKKHEGDVSDDELARLGKWLETLAENGGNFELAVKNLVVTDGSMFENPEPTRAASGVIMLGVRGDAVHELSSGVQDLLTA